MVVQFLLFVIAILLLAIFWELTKINSKLKKLYHQNARQIENTELSDPKS